MESLQNKIAKKSAGTKVTVKVQRQSQMGGYNEQTLTVTLGNKSQQSTTESTQSGN
jgi:S1-C subfamily serine protease